MTSKTATAPALTDKKWREYYRGDPRDLVACSLAEKMSKLTVSFVRASGNEEGGEDPCLYAERTKRPLLYFPDEIRYLLDRLVPYAVKICELAEDDSLQILGVTIARRHTPGSIPKVKFKVRKEVMAAGNYWDFSSPSVYIRGNEGSTIVLPEGGEDLLDQLRLHCLRAVDAEFERPVQQLDILTDKAELAEAAEMFEDGK